MNGVKLDRSGFTSISRHLARFGESSDNKRMLEKLDAIAAGELEATGYDVRFLTHEQREFERYTARGWTDGLPLDMDEQHRLWNTEHTFALEDYGVNVMRFPLFHPAALEDSDDW